MSENIVGSSGSESISTAPVQPSSANPSTAEASATANATKKEFSMDTTIGSVAELRRKAPEVYKKMLEGIAMTIIKSMRQHMAQLKKMMREAREQR
ncbi:MAG: hypothetical protein WB791_10100 [Waddliaceae bacterium]